MDHPTLALLFYEHPGLFDPLGQKLDSLSVETYRVRAWAAAQVIIARYCPQLVFVELATWKKSHRAIVNPAPGTAQDFNVIVVGPVPDIEHYVSTIEQGAFNFIAPPFSDEALTLAVHSTAADARRRIDSAAPISSSAHEAARQSGGSLAARHAGNIRRPTQPVGSGPLGN